MLNILFIDKSGSYGRNYFRSALANGKRIIDDIQALAPCEAFIVWLKPNEEMHFIFRQLKQTAIDRAGRPKRNRESVAHVSHLKSKNMFFLETVLNIKTVKIRDGLYYG